MRTRLSNIFSAINLIRNGGLDMVGSLDAKPPFWDVIGAEPGASSGNSYTIVQNETPATVQGAANYFKVMLSTGVSVELLYNFAGRWYGDETDVKKTPHIQMGFQDKLREDWNDWDWRWQSKYKNWETTLIRGIETSYSFSIRAQKGKVKVTLVINFKGGNSIEEEIYSSYSLKTWARPTTVVEPPATTHSGKIVESMAIRFDQVAGAGYTEVHVGEVMASIGGYETLPYTGDPMADAIPKGTIVFAFGDFCPQGFEKLDVSGIPESLGHAYLRNHSEPSLTAEGNESHDHSGTVIDTEDPSGVDEYVPTWPSEGPFDVRADDAIKPHTHELSNESVSPPSMHVLLCRRL